MQSILPKLRLSHLIISIALLLLCQGCNHRPVEASWSRPEPGRYRYSDRDLTIECHIKDRHILWYLKNSAFLPLTVDHGDIALRVEDDPVPYTLWGGPRDERVPMSPIEIKPQGFVRFDFPVRYDSPLFPFRTTREKRIYLELIARWGRSAVPYRIMFSNDGKSGADALTDGGEK